MTVTQSGTATDDTLTVTLAQGTAGTSLDLQKVTADGFETLTINSAGTSTAASTVKNVLDEVDGTTNDPNLILAGDKHLTINTTSTATTTGVEATFTNISVTNTAGVDVSIDAGGAVTFTGGAAADRVVLDTIADLTIADSLTGGEGHDTLAFSEVIEGDLTAAVKAVVSGFEAIEYVTANDMTATGAAAVTLDLTKYTGINELLLAGATTVDSTDTLTIKAVDGFTFRTGSTLASNATADVDISIKDASNAGTNNTVNYSIESDAAGATTAIAGFQIDNVENLAISVKGVFQASDVITISDVDGAQLTSITVSSTAGTNATTGVANVAETLVITAVETTAMTVFNASAATGAVTFQDISAYSGVGATITGGSAVDTFTGGVGADVITGNAGNDILNGDQGNDVITGGAGDDNINGDVGADILTGGAGKDTFVFDNAESAEATMDKVMDFAALATDQSFDTLDFAAAVVLTAGTAGDGVVTNNLDVKAAIASGAGTETVTASVTSGLVVLSGADKGLIDTVAEYVDVVEALITTAYVDAGDTLGFVHDGDTYIYNVTTASATNGNASDDVSTSNLVMLDGVVATAISTTEALDTVHIA